jgi:hypothetical protein
MLEEEAATQGPPIDRIVLDGIQGGPHYAKADALKGGVRGRSGVHVPSIEIMQLDVRTSRDGGG